MDDDVLGLSVGDPCPRCSNGILLLSAMIGASGSNPKQARVRSRGFRCAPRYPGDEVCRMEWSQVGPDRYSLRYPAAESES